MSNATTRRQWAKIARGRCLPNLGQARPYTVAAQPARPYLARVPLRSSARDHGAETAADSQVRPRRLARLEAALFAAGAPLGSRRLAESAILADAVEARALVRELNARYDADNSAFRVEQFAGGFQLLTRPEFSRWLGKLFQSRPQERLSRPALETLAIVAYRQPVLRADVEAIRGVECGEMLRQLMEKDLVRVAGRDSTLGRPILYGTTKKFLIVFGLKDLNDLPRADQLRLRPRQEEEAATGGGA
jgi:segregation and condensation protein B